MTADVARGLIASFADPPPLAPSGDRVWTASDFRQAIDGSIGEQVIALRSIHGECCAVSIRQGNRRLLETAVFEHLACSLGVTVDAVRRRVRRSVDGAAASSPALPDRSAELAGLGSIGHLHGLRFIGDLYIEESVAVGEHLTGADLTPPVTRRARQFSATWSGQDWSVTGCPAAR